MTRFFLLLTFPVPPTPCIGRLDLGDVSRLGQNGRRHFVVDGAASSRAARIVVAQLAHRDGVLLWDVMRLLGLAAAGSRVPQALGEGNVVQAAGAVGRLQ